MRIEDCPEWEYKTHDGHQEILRRQSASLLLSIVDWPTKTSSELVDTRLSHNHLFEELTPECCPYFAGSYRGSDFLCLHDYPVTVGGKSGAPPSSVSSDMSRFGDELASLLIETDKDIPALNEYENGRLAYVVMVACGAFMKFTAIHPYANGNGHIGRFMLISILYRYGYRVTRFEIEPNPGFPYEYCVREWEEGNAAPLMEYVMDSIG